MNRPLTMRLFVHDVSEYYRVTPNGRAFLERVGGTVWDVYSYIPDFVTHICSFERYHECWFLGSVTAAHVHGAGPEASNEQWWTETDEQLADANRDTAPVDYFYVKTCARRSVDDSANCDGSRAWDWTDLETALAEVPQDHEAIAEAERAIHESVRDHYNGNDLASVVARYLVEREV